MIEMLDFNYPYWQYTILFIYQFVSEHCLHSTLLLYSTFISLFRFTKLEVCTWKMSPEVLIECNIFPSTDRLCSVNNTYFPLCLSIFSRFLKVLAFFYRCFQPARFILHTKIPDCAHQRIRMLHVIGFRTWEKLIYYI